MPTIGLFYGYDFIDSVALEDGQFMGLALDNDNQPHLTARAFRPGHGNWSASLA
ncbi:MAG: hypothetical protein HC828_14080 [Blastochloris sp.]|nr:hypothetical protein [Blastochloris sp.]